MKLHRATCTAIAVMAATPLGAVGLGPLEQKGVIDGPREGFTLTLFNPYQEATAFRMYAIGPDGDEAPQNRVTILPAQTILGAQQARSLLIIANDLQPGETYNFRLCAERAQPPAGALIHARVCSKLSARRIG